MAGAWYQVFFDTDQADLSPRGQLIVNKVAEVVRTNDEVRATVIDRDRSRRHRRRERGSLGAAGGAGARRALIAAGVPAARIDSRPHRHEPAR
jgi:OOP family OmpA-OmpF porin